MDELVRRPLLLLHAGEVSRWHRIDAAEILALV